MSAKKIHTCENILTLPIPYNFADVFQNFILFIWSIKVPEHEKLTFDEVQP